MIAYFVLAILFVVFDFVCVAFTDACLSGFGLVEFCIRV